MTTIRLYTDKDTKALFEIFHVVGKAGDTYAHTEATTYEEFKAYWLAPQNHVYVAEDATGIVGTFIILQNRAGRGSHVANGAFMVHPAARGKGIGRVMGEYAIAEAKRLGFRAMQFNFVVSTNENAIKLWQSLGFNVIGTVPAGFDHARLGLVDAFIMHRFL